MTASERIRAAREGRRWYCFEDSRGRYLGKTETSEAVIRATFRRVTLAGNLVRIIAV